LTPPWGELKSIYEQIRSGIFMDEYLACVCARAGRLHEVLNEQFVDQQALDAAGDILRALIEGGPAESIDDYEHSAEACESYLNIVWARNDLGLRHLIAVIRLDAFLRGSEGWEKRLAGGWTDARRQSMQLLVNDILHRERWRELIDAALASGDEQSFDEGN
jgi:hypothetical protein